MSAPEKTLLFVFLVLHFLNVRIQAQPDPPHAQLIQLADSCFEAKDWFHARSFYHQARSLDKNDKYARDRDTLCSIYYTSDSLESVEIGLRIIKADSFYVVGAYKEVRETLLQLLWNHPLNRSVCKKLILIDSIIVEEPDNLIKQAELFFLKADFISADTCLRQHHRFLLKHITLPFQNSLSGNYANGLNSMNSFQMRFYAAVNIDSICSKMKKEADKDYQEERYWRCKAPYLFLILNNRADSITLQKNIKCDSILDSGKKDALLVGKQQDYYFVANRLYENGEYVKALSLFKYIVGLKPRFRNTENMTRDCSYRIQQCEYHIKQKGLSIENSSIAKEYNELIAQAGKLCANMEFQEAKQKYMHASKLLPDLQFPKDKIAECEKGIASLAKNKEYEELLAKAENEFRKGNLAEAKNSYKSALQVRPNSEYAKVRLAECDKMIKESGK